MSKLVTITSFPIRCVGLHLSFCIKNCNFRIKIQVKDEAGLAATPRLFDPQLDTHTRLAVVCHMDILFKGIASHVERFVPVSNRYHTSLVCLMQNGLHTYLKGQFQEIFDNFVCA